MSCVDNSGNHLASDSLEFSTRHLSSLRHHPSNSVASSMASAASAASTGSAKSSKSDYLTEMNLKLLPAISHSIQSGDIEENPIKVSTSSLSRSYYNKKTSPHAVLGKPLTTEVTQWDLSPKLIDKRIANSS